MRLTWVLQHFAQLSELMAMSSASLKFPAKLSEATEAGDKFVRLFYETFDKRRQVSTGHYGDVSQ